MQEIAKTKTWEKGWMEIQRFIDEKDGCKRYEMKMSTRIGCSFKSGFNHYLKKVKIVAPIIFSEDELHEVYQLYLSKKSKSLSKMFFNFMMKKFFAPMYESKYPKPKVRSTIQERYVVKQRYYEDKKLEDIGEEMELSRETIRRIEEKAICALRAYWLFESKENS